MVGVGFLVGNEGNEGKGEGGRVGGGVGTGKGTGESMRTRLSKLPFSHLPLSLSPIRTLNPPPFSLHLDIASVQRTGPPSGWSSPNLGVLERQEAGAAIQGPYFDPQVLKQTYPYFRRVSKGT